MGLGWRVSTAKMEWNGKREGGREGVNGCKVVVCPRLR